MKKIFALLLALCMVFSLAACSGGDAGNTQPGGSDNTVNPASGDKIKLNVIIS